MAAAASSGAVPTARLNTFEEALAAVAEGKFIIVVDDASRENEGDFIMPANIATGEAVALMLRHCTGLVCAALPPHQCKALGLPLMVPDNEMTDPLRTAFTVSVDAVGETTTGISAGDRAATLRALADPTSGPAAFTRPGHIFPLRARTPEGGVLARRGHTEATVDIAVAAGGPPVGYLCEVCDPWSKEMLRLPALAALAQELSLPLISIEDMAVWRARREKLVQHRGCTASQGGGTTHSYVATASFSPAGHAPMRITVHLRTGPSAGVAGGAPSSIPGVAVPLPVYTHVEAAAESVFGQGGSVLASASHGSQPGDCITGAVVVLHAQGGVVTSFDSAAAQPRPSSSVGAIATAYARDTPEALAAVLADVGLPEGWEGLPANLLHTEDVATLSTPVSALVAQALADALARGGQGEAATAYSHPLSMSVWTQEAPEGGCALRSPLPRLWAVGGAGASALQGATTPLPPLQGTAPGAEGVEKATVPVAPTRDITFTIAQAQAVSSSVQVAAATA